MMKIAALSALFASLVAGQALTLNSPASLPQCLPVQLTWQGGVAPFILTVIPAGDLSAPPITTISSSATSSPLTWLVNVAAGTNVTLTIRDSTGVQGFTSPIVIQTSSDSSCVGSAASVSSGSVGASTASSVSSAASSAASSASSTASSASSASSSSASSASAAASTGSPAGTSAAPSSTGKSGANAVSVGLTGMALTLGGVLLRVLA